MNGGGRREIRAIYSEIRAADRLRKEHFEGWAPVHCERFEPHWWSSRPVA